MAAYSNSPVVTHEINDDQRTRMSAEPLVPAERVAVEADVGYHPFGGSPRTKPSAASIKRNRRASSP